jgi:predicted DNA-binding helix-hairpin-helix protein
LAPEKSHKDVIKPLGFVQNQIVQFNDEKKLIKSIPKFVPAGQSTQMVIGATPEQTKKLCILLLLFIKISLCAGFIIRAISQLVMIQGCLS